MTHFSRPPPRERGVYFAYQWGKVKPLLSQPNHKKALDPGTKNAGIFVFPPSLHWRRDREEAPAAPHQMHATCPKRCQTRVWQRFA
ncbi:MAG: hypothetical protein LBP52_09450, partial [Burkholderiaceae bacterium]|nr:hypothetical protein [Burkholderiaceae bacterium]